MGRSEDFGNGAMFEDGDFGGVHSAVAATGSTNPKMLPPKSDDRWYGVPGSMQGDDLAYEKNWSQRDDD